MWGFTLALTGESDLIGKTTGSPVLSGSFCVTGEALVEATGVGKQSFANKLTKDVRQFKLELTPLQRQVNRLLRLMLLIVAFFRLFRPVSLQPWHQVFQMVAVRVGVDYQFQRPAPK